MATEIVALRSSEEEWAMERYLIMDALEATEKPRTHNFRDVDQHHRRAL